jgi:hypothetical protein
MWSDEMNINIYIFYVYKKIYVFWMWNKNTFGLNISI